MIVAEDQADPLIELLLQQMGRIKVGDGMAEGTTMGPLVSKAQFDVVSGYVRQGVESGCRVLAGGRPLVENPEQEGYYYAATLFDRVTPDSPLAVEEIFGPVLPVIRVRNASEAISVANGTPYGLAAAVFSSRRDLIQQFVSGIEAGMIHINHGTASQAHVPFGGRKDSGYGAFSIGPTAREFYRNQRSSMSSGRTPQQGTSQGLDRLPEIMQLGTRVYQVLLNGIINGVFEAGVALRPDVIARQLEVSATPVREALYRLEGDGLAVKQPNQGWFVRVHARQQIQELYESRGALECFSVRLDASASAPTRWPGCAATRPPARPL